MPTINSDGVSLYYQVKGNGIPIVFIHPPLLTSSNFNYQVEGLADSLQTIVFDIRGHGNSSYSKERITYSLITDDIKKLLDHLKLEKAFLCGYSTGGSIVLDFLLTYPERAYGGILLGTMSEVNDVILKNKIILATKLANNTSFKVLAASICFGNADNNRTFKHLYREATKGNIENIRQYYQYSLNFNCTKQLKYIKHPVLLIYGEKDKQFHHYARLNQQHLVNSELIFLNNAKHQIPTKYPDELNGLLRKFVNNHKK